MKKVKFLLYLFFPILTFALLFFSGCTKIFDGENTPGYLTLAPKSTSDYATFSMTDAGTYALVWYDEFDYSGYPDPNKWGYDIGGGGWGNNEAQFYTDSLENARVENGNLIIEARKKR